MAKLSRRKLLALVPVLLGGAGLFGSAGLYAVSRPADVVTAIVRRYFPDTEIPAPMLRDFAERFAAIDEFTEIPQFRLLRVASPFLASDLFRSLLPGRVRRDLETFERFVVTRFIYSTDYLAQYDEGRDRITFMRFWDPDTACDNPLTRWT